MKNLLEWDFRVFEMVNGLAGKNAFLDFIIVFFAHYYVFVFPVLGLLYVYFHQDKINIYHAVTNQVVVLIVARGLVTELIRLFYKRTRPFLDHSVTQLISKNAEASFPSGHTIGIVAIGVSLWLLDKKLGLFVGVSGLVIGFFRIAAGVHYPLDVFAGIVLAFPSALIGDKIYKYFIK